MTTETRRANFVVIGENVHTTRVLLKRGKRYVAGEDGAGEGISFTDTGGNAGLLPVTDWVRKTQDYDEGRIKHVMIAVKTAMAEAENADIAMAYLRQLVANQEKNGAAYLDINVDEISIHMSERQEAMAWAVGALREMSELPIAVIYQVGTADAAIPYEGGQSGFENTGEFQSAAASVAHWVAHNQCEQIPTADDYPDLDPADGSTAHREVHACPSTGAAVSITTMVGAGHVAPSSQVQVSGLWEAIAGKQNHDLEGAREIWAFLQDHSR